MVNIILLVNLKPLLAVVVKDSGAFFRLGNLKVARTVPETSGIIFVSGVFCI
jgi:hypothetical protein